MTMCRASYGKIEQERIFGEGVLFFKKATIAIMVPQTHKLNLILITPPSPTSQYHQHMNFGIRLSTLTFEGHIKVMVTAHAMFSDQVSGIIRETRCMLSTVSVQKGHTRCIYIKRLYTETHTVL